jgi:hypothetical protein
MNDLHEISSWSARIRLHTGLMAGQAPSGYDLARASNIGPSLRSKEIALHDKTEAARPRAGPH